MIGKFNRIILLSLNTDTHNIKFTATTTYSFVVWDFNNIIPRGNHEAEKKNKEDDEKKEEEEVSVISNEKILIIATL